MNWKNPPPVEVIDRASGRPFKEKVMGLKALAFGLYHPLGKGLFFLLARLSWVSKAFGLYMRMPWTRNKIRAFIRDFSINKNEFEKDISEFKNFNDFFIRKLKKNARPLSKDPWVLPADARYLFFQNIEAHLEVFVKGNTFTLAELLGNERLAKIFEGGFATIARLAPPDYHRFIAPFDAPKPKVYDLGNKLLSVNPLATSQDANIFCKNKRKLLLFNSPNHGKIALLIIGATHVGSIHLHPINAPIKKGDELGYFSFGGSCLILLFEKSFRLCPDLEKLSKSGQEIYCKMGQSFIVP